MFLGLSMYYQNGNGVYTIDLMYMHVYSIVYDYKRELFLFKQNLTVKDHSVQS